MNLCPTPGQKIPTSLSFFKDPSRNSADRSGRERRPAGVVLCAVVSEPGSTEVMENLPLTSHARHPLLYTMIPSLDFRQGGAQICTCRGLHMMLVHCTVRNIIISRFYLCQKNPRAVFMFTRQRWSSTTFSL
jgi:hypothetical protein